jgi:hypothetical protein
LLLDAPVLDADLRPACGEVLVLDLVVGVEVRELRWDVLLVRVRIVQIGKYLLEVELVVAVLVPYLFDVHRRSNDCTREDVLVGDHLQDVWVDHALAHLEVNFIVEAEAHLLADDAALVAPRFTPAVRQAVQFAFLVHNW